MTNNQLTIEKRITEICTNQNCVDSEVLETVIHLALEIAREGSEGRNIGTLFVVGDQDEVLHRSKALILDPLALHPPEKRHLGESGVKESVKALAQLDGAFVISDEGIVLSGCRYIDASSDGIQLPLGLGSRHMAGASISHQTNAVAVVVSETTIIRVFHDGQIIGEITP